MGNHSGIINIRDRLRHVHGSKGRLYIESKYGTEAKITIFAKNESNTEFGGKENERATKDRICYWKPCV